MRAEAGIADDADAEAARRALLALLPDSNDRARIVDGLADILGIGHTQLAEGEAFWSVRRLLEELAGNATTVLLVEDVHWAEPTLLDLLDGLVDWMRDSPLLVVCTARPDIYERREGWGGRPGATTLSLRPLARADVDRLIENLINHPTLDDDAKQRIDGGGRGQPAVRRAAARDDDRRGAAAPRRNHMDVGRRISAVSRCRPRCTPCLPPGSTVSRPISAPCLASRP